MKEDYSHFLLLLSFFRLLASQQILYEAFLCLLFCFCVDECFSGHSLLRMAYSPHITHMYIVFLCFLYMHILRTPQQCDITHYVKWNFQNRIP